MKTERTKTPDPQLRQQLDAKIQKYNEAFDKNDAGAVAAFFTEDAVLVTDKGPIYGREAIEKHFADLFQNVHFSNHIDKADQYSPHIIGTAGNEMWSNGEWSLTLQEKTGDPIPLKGYWSEIYVREGDAWKVRMQIWNITPAPAAPAETK
jgi:ketosteroid isomerase-like protein